MRQLPFRRCAILPGGVFDIWIRKLSYVCGVQKGTVMEFLMNENVQLSKREQAYQYLKEQIICRRLLPGSVISEKQLSAELNSSRTPIREAIQALISEGLVVSIPSKGYLVSDISYESITQLYEVREYLERFAARQAALAMHPGQLEAMGQLCDEMEGDIERHDYNSLTRSDIIFHRTLIEASHNLILQKLYSQISGQIERITNLILVNSSNVARSHLQHVSLVQALTNQDADAAEDIMKLHITENKLVHLQSFAPNIFGISRV